MVSSASQKCEHNPTCIRWFNMVAFIVQIVACLVINGLLTRIRSRLFTVMPRSPITWRMCMCGAAASALNDSRERVYLTSNCAAKCCFHLIRILIEVRG